MPTTRSNSVTMATDDGLHTTRLTKAKWRCWLAQKVAQRVAELCMSGCSGWSSEEGSPHRREGGGAGAIQCGEEKVERESEMVSEE